MHDEPSWWSFSLTDDAPPAVGTESHAEAGSASNEREPAAHYGSYLGLEKLLSAQVPVSAVPEERIFVVVHQLFELVFKQMVFDLGVVAKTLESLLALGDEAFQAEALEALPDERGPSERWRPAMTASARLRHAARRVLPTVMTFLGRGEDDDVLFSTLEYKRFREALAPASGFQTAQLRLIQRAFGKDPLLGVRVFPGELYGQRYAGTPCGHVALGDPLILQDEHARAFPPAGHPEHMVTRLDDVAHKVLARLAGSAEGLHVPPSVRVIHAEEVDRAAARVRATLGDEPEADAVLAHFRADLEKAVEQENSRRHMLGDARRGAQALHARHRRTALAFTLDRIAATDAALHAPDPGSFLTVHRKTVRRHVSDNSGTGGGGMPYLVTSQRFLLPLFPALVAYSDLGLAGTDEEGERW